jgi:hypothetical protein
MHLQALGLHRLFPHNATHSIPSGGVHCSVVRDALKDYHVIGHEVMRCPGDVDGFGRVVAALVSAIDPGKVL